MCAAACQRIQGFGASFHYAGDEEQYVSYTPGLR